MLLRTELTVLLLKIYTHMYYNVELVGHSILNHRHTLLVGFTCASMYYTKLIVKSCIDSYLQ